MNDKKIIIGIVAISVLILVGGAYFLGKSENSTPRIVASSSTQKGNPQAEVKITSFNLGDMKVSDEKSTDFIIKNLGTGSLQITGVSTSCHCTAARVIYEGNESQEFGMHAPGDTVISEIAPLKQAVLRITYRPFLMPVYGFVEREAYVVTNDPQNSKITFKVTANVK